MKRWRKAPQAPQVLLLLLLLAAFLPGCSRQEGKRQAGAGAAPPAEQSPAADAASPAADAASPAAGPAREAVVSFAGDIAPIFAGKCNFCHHPDNAVKVDLTRPFHPQLGLIMRSNSWTRSEKKHLVVPGDPEASALIWKVEQAELDPKIDGDPMPWNIPALSASELDSLERWIREGARDDELYRGTIRRLFGDGVSLGSRGGKCAYCHHPGASFGADLTSPFDPMRGVVDVRSDLGGLRVVPGDPRASLLFLKVRGEPLAPGQGGPMPPRIERLTAEQLRLLRAWIAQGALDN